MPARHAIYGWCVWMAGVAATAQTGQPGSTRMAIYRDFLDGYDHQQQTTLYMAQSTSAFAAQGFVRTCLKPFGLGDQSARTLHAFAPDSFPGHKVFFVDPAAHQLADPDEALLRGATVDQARADGYAAGVLTLSEIVFDPSHRRAAFTYSFVCGRLCGHGATVVYQRKAGKWTQEKTDCGSWSS